MTEQQLSEQLESARIARRKLRAAYLESVESARNCRIEAGAESTIDDLRAECDAAMMAVADAHHAELTSERHDTASIAESCAAYNRAWERYTEARNRYWAAIPQARYLEQRARIMGVAA